MDQYAKHKLKLKYWYRYMDDMVAILKTKKEAIEKLVRLSGDKPKGQLASLIRVLLRQFIATPDDKVNRLLIDAVAAEYEYSAKLNKRSRL